VIDVVVVTADSKEMVLQCLQELAAPSIVTVFVVDNASQDGTGEAVLAAFPSVQLVRLTAPRGLAAAFNRGAERGQAPLVLFLNDDVLAAPGAIEELAQELNRNESAVAAAGRLVDPVDGSTQLEYQPKPFPTAATLLAALAGVPRVWPGNPWTGRQLRRPLDERETVVVDQPPGACLLVRRDVFELVGGWDEGYAFWYEDVDLARRLKEHGSVIYVPTAVFRHVGGHSARRLSRAEVIERSYGGTLRYAEHHLARGQQRVVGAAFAFAGAVRSVSARHRDPALADVYRRVRRQAVALALGRDRGAT
jgi:N-acetylglucosaminyl-diphospho-decaprenol L-rhamnosyltransferase